MNQELEALAETLNSARETANGIEAVAAQSSAYGFIAQALQSVLGELLGTANVDAAYASLLDGNSVASAIAYATGERTSYLACFSDDALAAMATGGYWNDATGKLETATLEEVQAVHARRAAREARWLLDNPEAELESFTEDADVIDTVVLRVFGGDSAPARATVAHDYLEDFTERQTKPVVTNAYECKAKVSESGTPYVEFTFSAIDFF